MKSSYEVPQIGMTFGRELMPQIDKPKEFLSFLKKKFGIDHSLQTLDTDSLKSTQSEFVDDKISSLINSKESKKPIIVSTDGHILDGHHRWIACHNTTGKTPAYVIDHPVLELHHKAKQFNALSEEITHKEFGPMLDSFVSFASKRLGIKSLPTVGYKQDTDDDFSSFGAYRPSEKSIVVATKNRHPMDIFRTVAHELVHHKQNEEGRIKDVAKEGSTGSPIEDEANAQAGVLLRHYAKENPTTFGASSLVEEKTAVFVLGVPCSGKDSVIKDIKAHIVIQEMDIQRLHRVNLSGHQNILLSAVAHDYASVVQAKSLLESKGFSTELIFVDTPNEISKLRNEQRSGRGQRMIAESIRFRKFEQSQANYAAFMEEFEGKVSRVMNDHVQLDEVFSAFVSEGVDDPSILKAVFMAGGPGSGKDYIMGQTTSGMGLTEINSDVALEFLMKRRGLDLKMPDSETAAREVVRGKAKAITTEKQNLALSGRNGLIINGTGDDPKKILKLKQELEKLGYDTMMLFVNTSNDVSRERNMMRGARGGRKVPDGTDAQGKPDGSLDIRGEKWHAAQLAKSDLQKIFGQDAFVEFDNSADMTAISDVRKRVIQNQLSSIWKKVKKFTVAPPSNETAVNWIKSKAPTAGRPKAFSYGDPRQNKPSSLFSGPEHSQSVMDHAKELGLTYFGFGRYGRMIDGANKVTHMFSSGRLIPVVAKQRNSEKLKRRYALREKKESNKDGLINESVIQWYQNPRTLEKFTEKYGNRAKEKLLEAAKRLDTTQHNKVKKVTKSLKTIRECEAINEADSRIERANVEGFNKPKRTPDHPNKSHIVVAKQGSQIKTIRFGEQGAETAGKPKEGESDRMKTKRASFKARHGKNIVKGKMSAAYWANKVKW
jgi:hypothetical protein